MKTIPKKWQFLILGIVGLLILPVFSKSWGSEIASQEASTSAEKLILKPAPKEKSRFALSLSAGGGLSYDAAAEAKNYASQSLFFGGLNVSFYLLDGCQSTKMGRLAPCADLLLSLEIGGEYWFESQAPRVQIRFGFETDAFLGHQRAVALTTKIEFGYGRSFGSPDSVPTTGGFHNSGGNSFLLAAGPGILLNFGSFSKANGLSLFLDTHFQYAGTYYVGFLVSPGLRYRF